MNFMDKLLFLINERGITQSQFLKDLNLSSSAIQNWKRQGSRPRPETMKMIAEYFNVERQSLEDDAQIIRTIRDTSKWSYHDGDDMCLGMVQRVKAIKCDYQIDKDKIERFAMFLDADFNFLINTSEKKYDPKVHAYRNKRIIDLTTLFEILEFADSCTTSDLSRNVMTQISRVIIYRVMKAHKNPLGMSEEDYWKIMIHISEYKVKYLLNQPSENKEMNYGFNLSELFEIKNKTHLDFYYLFAGIGKSSRDYDYVTELASENELLKERISKLESNV